MHRPYCVPLVTLIEHDHNTHDIDSRFRFSIDPTPWARIFCLLDIRTAPTMRIEGGHPSTHLQCEMARKRACKACDRCRLRKTKVCLERSWQNIPVAIWCGVD
jgi:hypothetical protein